MAAPAPDRSRRNSRSCLFVKDSRYVVKYFITPGCKILLDRYLGKIRTSAPCLGTLSHRARGLHPYRETAGQRPKLFVCQRVILSQSVEMKCPRDWRDRGPGDAPGRCLT